MPAFASPLEKDRSPRAMGFQLINERLVKGEIDDLLPWTIATATRKPVKRVAGRANALEPWADLPMADQAPRAANDDITRSHTRTALDKRSQCAIVVDVVSPQGALHEAAP